MGILNMLRFRLPAAGLAVHVDARPDSHRSDARTDGRTLGFASQRVLMMERVMGIEPTLPAWKAGVLPLNYTRKNGRDDTI